MNQICSFLQLEPKAKGRENGTEKNIMEEIVAKMFPDLVK